MLEKSTVLARLDAWGIEYSVFDHPPVMTAAEAEHIRALAGDKGRHCKNLFLTPVRRGRNQRFFLLSVPVEATPDLKALGLQVATAKLELTSAEYLAAYLGLLPGSVSPLALIHPRAAEVTLLLDKRLAGEAYLSFHPGVNTSTCVLSQAAFSGYLKRLPNPILWIDLPEAGKPVEGGSV